MQTYIVLVRFTEQGLKTIKDGPARLEQARETFRAAGGRIRDFYLTTGQYDSVVVVETPDEMTQARLALAVGAQGNSRSETLRAFSEDEYRKLVSGLP